MRIALAALAFALGAAGASAAELPCAQRSVAIIAFAFQHEAELIEIVPVAWLGIIGPLPR